MRPAARPAAREVQAQGADGEDGGGARHVVEALGAGEDGGRGGGGLHGEGGGRAGDEGAQQRERKDVMRRSAWRSDMVVAAAFSCCVFPAAPLLLCLLCAYSAPFCGRDVMCGGAATAVGAEKEK
ncbi:hypothetical protein ACCO45_004181 [Purpureocillium lilacinum]|uniref:Uncharacterized protein n=1 Tax=Purpureocillium lilacinum TaxID=33203 RepID=A0ACC4E350_PURLI